jgi:hypothetical protein
VQRLPPPTPATHGNLQRERSVQEFPAPQLEEVLRECRALPHPVFSAPPPGIERLSVDDLRRLEGTLRRRFMHGGQNPDAPALSQETREAAQAWGMVQAVRMRRPRSNAHDASLRAERADALNDFLQILHPSMGLPPSLRMHLMVAFNHQATEGTIPPQVEAAVEAQGIEALAAQGYRLDGRTGAFAPASERLSNHVLGLSSTPLPGTGRLAESEQHRYIKSMTPEERTLLEASLEGRFLNPGDPLPPETLHGALTAWLTLQEARLRVHSEASIHQRAQAPQSAGGHEPPSRHEQAIAINNFLRLLHPSSPLPADLQQRIAEHLSHLAESDGTLPTAVVAAIGRQGPQALAAADWRFNPADNVFSPPPFVLIAPKKAAYWLATPAPFAPAGPAGPLQAGSGTPASTPAPR